MRRGYGEPAARPRHPRGRPPRATGTADVVGRPPWRWPSRSRRRWWYVAGRRRCGRRRRAVAAPRRRRRRAGRDRRRGGPTRRGRRCSPTRSDRSPGGRRSSASRSAPAGADRVVLVVDGERYEVWVRGRARRQRVAAVAGRRSGARGRRAAGARRPAADDASRGSTSSASSTSPGSATRPPGTPAAERVQPGARADPRAARPRCPPTGRRWPGGWSSATTATSRRR